MLSAGKQSAGQKRKLRFIRWRKKKKTEKTETETACVDDGECLCEYVVSK